MNSSTDTPDYIAPSAVLAGSSNAVLRLRLQLARFGPHFRTILLSGETGTGKHFLANKLHASSPVAAKPVAAIALADFAVGQEITGPFLYLYGLSGLSGAAYTRVIDKLEKLSRETRVVIACSTDPCGLAAAGRFRADALGKVGLLELHVPPLRERLDDLDEIASAAFAGGNYPRFSEEQLGHLRSHTWPGNLREFAQVCQVFKNTGQIQINVSPSNDAKPMQRLDTVVSEHVSRVLEHCAGNKFRAAEILGISRSTLYRML